MKLHIMPGALSAALTVATSTIGKSHFLPVVNCVLLEATPDGGLVATGTDLKSRSSHTVTAQVIEAGAVAVRPDALRSFLEAVPGSETITITANGSNRVELVCGKIRARAAGFSAEEFPAAPSFDDPLVDVTIGAETLSLLVASVAHAVAPDDSRPVLAGILVRIKDGRLTCAAADGLRLAARSAEVEDAPDLDVVAQGKTLIKAAGMLAKATSARLVVDTGRSMLLIDSEVGQWSVALVDGQFPDYRRVVPKDAETVVSVNHDDIRRAMKLIRNLQVEVTGNGGRSMTVMARMTIGAESVEIHASDTTSDQEAEMTIPAVLERGEATSVTINGAFLLDAVEAIDGQRVVLELMGHAKPVLIRPIDNDGSHLQVLMAMNDPRPSAPAPRATVGGGGL